VSVGGRTLRIGTRGSALALAQATLVRDALRARGAEVGLVTIVTEGDRHAVDTPWGEGAFVTAIEAALRDGRVDVAVHSAKDVPIDGDGRLRIGAYLPREEPLDVIVVRPGEAPTGLADLPAGSRVGTDSPRRSAFLRAVRPDLEIGPLHGNVDTRLRRLDEGAADALVLAAAGLRRLERAERVAFRLDPSVVPPAPGQGAIAVQARADDTAVIDVLAALDDGPTRVAVEAERAFLAATGGGCRAPVGALGTVVGDDLELLAGHARPDGRVAAVVRARRPAGEAAALVEALLEQLAEAAAAAARTAGAPRVVVARPRDRWAALGLALVDRGFAPLLVRAIEIEIAPDEALVRAVGQLGRFDWVVVTSVNGVRGLVAAADAAGLRLCHAAERRHLRWAAVGEATERALAGAGIGGAIRPERATGAALADGLPVRAGDRVLLALGDLADGALARRLAERGARVETALAYRTLEAPSSSASSLAAALEERPAGWVATSPSSLRGLLRLAEGLGAADAIRALPLVVIGPTTAAAAGRAGLAVAAEAADPAPGSIADAAVAALAAPPEEP
jgi:hydroxymethylbilane synthase